jgi:spermidine synthase
LIGGLGMGFTLRQTLDLMPKKARVTVAELIPEVVVWNRDYLGELTDHPLRDPRVVIQNRDVRRVIDAARQRFDVVLLDTDNGPSAMTVADNAALYRPAGLQAVMRALKPGGALAIWSVNGDASFEKLLRREKLAYRLERVAASKSAKSRSRYIWLIARDRQSLPRE